VEVCLLSERRFFSHAGSGGRLVRPPSPGSRGGLGVTHREMPLFGSSGLWTPPLQVAGYGARRPDPRHQTARLQEAATTHAADSDSEMSLPVPKPGRESTPCWQCGKVGHWAEVCPTLDARLRDRLAAALRWSPLGAPSGSRDTQRMGRRVAVATPNEDSSASGDE